MPLALAWSGLPSTKDRCRRMTAWVTAPPGGGCRNSACWQRSAPLPSRPAWGAVVFLTFAFLLFSDKDINARATQMLRSKR